MKPDLTLLTTILQCPDLSSFERSKLDGYRDMLTDGRRQKLKTKEREWALDLAERYEITIPSSARKPAGATVTHLPQAAAQAFEPPLPAALDRANLVLCPVVPPHRRCEHNQERGSCAECKKPTTNTERKSA